MRAAGSARTVQQWSNDCRKSTANDPADLGYNISDFWCDTDLHVGLALDGWGVWWGYWRHRLHACRETPKCTHWMFSWDPETYAGEGGGCSYKTGVQYAGVVAAGRHVKTGLSIH